MQTEQTTPTQTPAPMSLREHIQAEAAPVETPSADPVVQEPVQAASESPELEAESTKPDAELSEAARALRRNRADERKKKLHLEVQEALGERARVRDELAREREELARLRSEREQISRGAQPRIATAASHADPTDPEPQEGDFQDYPQFIAAQARWAARDEQRRLAAQGRERIARQTSEHARQQTASKLDAQHESGRATYADFDAVVDSVLAQLPERDPRRGDIASFLESSDVGEHIFYRLGRDAEAMKVIKAAPNAPALMRALRDVEATILAARKAPKPTTSAPVPPSQTVTSGQTSATSRTSDNTADHYRKEQAEIEERRKLGYRY